MRHGAGISGKCQSPTCCARLNALAGCRQAQVSPPQSRSASTPLREPRSLALGLVSVLLRVFVLSPGAIFSKVCGKVHKEGKESEVARQEAKQCFAISRQTTSPNICILGLSLEPADLDINHETVLESLVKYKLNTCFVVPKRVIS